MTAQQLACIIKVQAVMRGFLTRKALRANNMQIEMAGMGSGGMYDEDGQLQQDYDNPKVQVSTLSYQLRLTIFISFTGNQRRTRSIRLRCFAKQWQRGSRNETTTRIGKPCKIRRRVVSCYLKLVYV